MNTKQKKNNDQEKQKRKHIQIKGQRVITQFQLCFLYTQKEQTIGCIFMRKTLFVSVYTDQSFYYYEQKNYT